jgi:predicted phage terminase large subunit-like protein
MLAGHEMVQQLKALASRVLARRRLIPFIQRMNPRYLAGWVHEDIARRLEKFSDDVEKGLSPRLMLLMPPRHGKSELASRLFPPWHLGRCPDHEIIACSYNMGLAMTFSRRVKTVLEMPSYQSVFETRLNSNHQSVEEWGLDGAAGGYVAAGIGGGITGRGCHILVIDDPFKSSAAADSADEREKVWEWYVSTAYTRLSPGGGVLLIQTCWHDDDLAGRIQQAMAEDPGTDQFEIVRYPAIAEDDEYLDVVTDLIVQGQERDEGAEYRLVRCKDEALHPERYDLTKLLRIKKVMPPRFWSALYQQNPVPDDGDYFLKEQFRRATPPPVRFAHVFMAWDFAISEKKVNDYTVGSVILQDYDDVLNVAEVVRFKSGDSFRIVEAILNLVERWYSPTLTLGFEDGQIYRAIEALLKKRMRERKMYPSIKVLPPITDKLARARVLQGRMQQSLVTFAAGAEWYETVRNEMLRFPAGRHDDCVDSLAWCARLAIGTEPPKPPKIKEMPSWKDKLRLSPANLSHMAA